MTTHSTLAAQFAGRIGLDAAVRVAVGQAYEQWDGKGQPRHLRGAGICLPARLVQLASPVEVFSRRHGVDAAVTMARRHRGTQFDPDVVDLFCGHVAQLLDGLDQAAGWDAIIGAEPRLARRVAGPELDGVLEAMADLVDLKSPYLAGHSRGVANLVAEAARVLGMVADGVDTVRRAGLIHDLGRLGVSNAVWDRAGPLTESQRERVRLHPYSDRTHAGPCHRAGRQPRDRRAPSRTAGRVGVSTRADRGGADAVGSAAGSRRRLPRDDRAPAAPAAARRRGRRARAAGRGAGRAAGRRGGQRRAAGGGSARAGPAGLAGRADRA